MLENMLKILHIYELKLIYYKFITKKYTEFFFFVKEKLFIDITQNVMLQ